MNELPAYYTDRKGLTHNVRHVFPRGEDGRGRERTLEELRCVLEGAAPEDGAALPERNGQGARRSEAPEEGR